MSSADLESPGVDGGVVHRAHVSKVGAASVDRIRQQRAWYAYDWANSGFFTTVMTVLIGPYLTAIARDAACPQPGVANDCRANLSVLGLPIDPGSLVTYLITTITILTAFLLPLVGAVVDRVRRPRVLLGGFAWVGASAAMSLWWVTGTRWELAVVLIVISNMCFAASLVVYDALLVQVATPKERDRVSSRGWALGYCAGFIMLALSLALVNLSANFGLSTGQAVRVSLFLAGLWWAGFTVIPVLLLRDRPLMKATHPLTLKVVFQQLWRTLRDLRDYPQTRRFLIAYLIFNDGVQTVIFAASLYGSEELNMSTQVLVASVLVVQAVAFFGALVFGQLAIRFGARDVIIASLGLWIVVVGAAYLLPAGQVGWWFALASALGLVLGGTQALSRSLYSQLVPVGREAEFFSLYQAGERGTSWLGTLIFGLVQQLTHSYRPALLALVFFFVLGGALLGRVHVIPGRAAAGQGPGAD